MEQNNSNTEERKLKYRNSVQRIVILNKNDFTELKSLGTPPALLVEVVTLFIQVLNNTTKACDWKGVVQHLSNTTQLFKQIQEYNPEKIDPAVKQLIESKNLDREKVQKTSQVSFYFLDWLENVQQQAP